MGGLVNPITLCTLHPQGAFRHFTSQPENLQCPSQAAIARRRRARARTVAHMRGVGLQIT